MPTLLSGTPKALKNSAGLLNVFVLESTQGRIWQIVQTPGGGFTPNWSWQQLPQPPEALGSDAAVVLNPAGRFELFATTLSGRLYQTWQVDSSSNAWASWSLAATIPTGGTGSDFAISLDATGRAYVFAIGFDSSANTAAVYYVRQIDVAGGWTSLELLDRLPTNTDPGGCKLVAGQSQNGGIELFVQSVDASAATINHKYQTAAEPSPQWSGWVQRGTFFSDQFTRPSLTLSYGTLILYVTGGQQPDSASVQYISQMGEDSTNWTSVWQPVNESVLFLGGSPCAIAGALPQVCAVSPPDRIAMQSTFFVFPAQGWSTWQPIYSGEKVPPEIGGSERDLATAVDNQNRPLMFVVAEDNLLWFTTREGIFDWQPWTSLGTPPG